MGKRLRSLCRLTHTTPQQKTHVMMDFPQLKTDTLATRAGRDHANCGRLVNPPIERATTVLASSLAEWKQTCSLTATEDRSRYYGRFGTGTTRALEQAMAELEGGYKAMLFPSGLAASTHSLMAFARPGDHVLIVDSVYGPIRHFASETLRSFGIEVSFYDPKASSDIARLVKPNTRVIYMESPGSMSFEVQDVPAICEVAKKHDITTIIDNTWATPLYFKPLTFGVDVSIQSATKYICGHSDTLLGIATCQQEAWEKLVRSAGNFGETASPDAAYVALRGIRTLPTRLRQHHASGLEVARWLKKQPEVAHVLHPALPGDAGHALWRRDFKGASGLFACVLHPVSPRAFAAFIDSLQLFGLGASWGGFESLVAPIDLSSQRSCTRWPHVGPAVRLHIGLEDPGDLIEDLARALLVMTRQSTPALEHGEPSSM